MEKEGTMFVVTGRAGAVKLSVSAIAGLVAITF